MSDNTQQSQPIQRIWGGKYRELKVLNDSEGNFAIVYLVEHIHLHRLHAMKVLRTSLITEVGRKKFEQEAQLVAHLNHPHIVRVIDYGIEPDGTPFIVKDGAKDLRVGPPMAGRKRMESGILQEVFLFTTAKSMVLTLFGEA